MKWYNESMKKINTFKRMRAFRIVIVYILMLAASLFLFSCAPAGTPVYFICQGELYATRYAKANTLLSFPDDPVVDGMTFINWIDGSGEVFKEDTFLASTPPTTSITVYAKIEALAYAIVYNLDGGVLPKGAITSYSYSAIAQTLPVPTKEGMEFAGWDLEGTIVRAIPEGMTGELNLTATWSVTTYTMTFDTRGGSSIEAISAPAGTILSKPTDPIKSDNLFTGWYKDILCTEAYEITTMPAGDLTLYAGWEGNANHELVYLTSETDVTLSGNKYSGERVTSGESVMLIAPGATRGKVFAGWYVNEELVARTPSYAFTMPAMDLELKACYIESFSMCYDRASGTDLVLEASSLGNITALDGSGLTPSDYEIHGSTITIPERVARTLPLGETTLLISGEKDAIIYLEVTSTALAQDLVIDYDVAYPEVILSYAGESEYVVSLNGGSYVEASSGMILEDYDKSIENSVTLKDKVTGESVTVVHEAWNSSSKTYYNKSFTYGGETQDYVFETTEELVAFLHYITLAEGITKKQATPKAPYGTYESKGYVAANIQATDTTVLLNPLLSSFSCPMDVLFSYSGGTKSHPVLTFKVTYGAVLNTEKTEEELNVLTDKQGLNLSSTRDVNYDAFKINRWTKVQEIHTLYELEDLAYGVKPIIESGTLALEVYREAESILRTIIDDKMTDYEKVTAIYDWIALNVTYDEMATTKETPGAYRAYTSAGALLDRKAVCDGISSAFFLLCMIEGIECREVIGLFNGGGHAWNKVKIDGIWWGVDATWARAESYVTHAFLFLDEKALVVTGHVENGSANVPRVTNIAGALCNWYDMQILDHAGHTRLVTSTSDLKAALMYAQDNNIESMEILSDLGGQFETEIKLASFSSGISYTSYSSYTVAGLEGKIYYINL